VTNNDIKTWENVSQITYQCSLKHKLIIMNNLVASPKLVDKTTSRKDNFNTTYKILFEQKQDLLSFQELQNAKNYIAFA
jgi:hypothetical protein